MLEEKIEALTKEIVALRQAVEKNGTGTAAAAKAPAAAATAAAAKAPAKKGKAKVEPEHDSDETGAIFRKAAKEDKPACRKYLKGVGCADLAELLTKPELYDAAYTFAEELLEAAPDEDEDEDDDEV
jgi:hypothetical protein